MLERLLDRDMVGDKPVAAVDLDMGLVPGHRRLDHLVHLLIDPHEATSGATSSEHGRYTLIEDVKEAAMCAVQNKTPGTHS